jgi:hypothetical protein
LAVLSILVAVVVLSVAENLQEVAAVGAVGGTVTGGRPRPLSRRVQSGFSGQKVIGPSLLVVVLLPTGLLRMACWQQPSGRQPWSREQRRTAVWPSGALPSPVVDPPPTNRGELATEHVLVVGSGRDLPARAGGQFPAPKHR